MFLSTLKAGRQAFAVRHPKITGDVGNARVLRSVLMKRESEHRIEHLHARVEQIARSRRSAAQPGN